MPYDKVENHPDCEDGEIAVVKADDTEEVMGCHSDESEADAQIRALMMEEEDGDEEAAADVAWEAPNGIVLEGTPTGDGRLIERDALTWLDPSATLIPLRWLPADVGGHDGAVNVGRIDTLTRDGDRIVATGVMHTIGPEAQRALELMRGGFLRGVSVDLDDVAADITEDDDGNMTMTVTAARIRAATLCDIPAFAGAEITLVDAEPLAASATPITAGPMTTLDSGAGFSFVASADTDAPPAEWFEDPALDRRRGLHIESDGRVWGHVYGWGECHLGSPPGQCITVPRGSTDGGFYAGQDGRGVLTDKGTLAPTGPLVLAADHAALNLPWLAAKDHYAHTGLAWGDACCGEDDHGIWVAGAVRPGTPPELVHAARASAPSVDCRGIAGRLRLIALLSVNMPGYPALAAHIDGAQVTALVASGTPISEGCGCGGSCATSTTIAEAQARLARQVDALWALTANAREAALEDLDAAMDAGALVAAIDAEMVPPRRALVDILA